MSQPGWTWQLEHRIPSRTSAAEEVVSALLAQLEAHEWESHDVFGVHIAVEEALVNAIEHGNRRDPSKWVYIHMLGSRDQLRVEITDEGPGFDPASIPDPTDPGRLDVPRGRGLMLIRTFMTCVEYKGCGNRLVMEKRRAS